MKLFFVPLFSLNQPLILLWKNQHCSRAAAGKEKPSALIHFSFNSLSCAFSIRFVLFLSSYMHLYLCIYTAHQQGFITRYWFVFITVYCCTILMSNILLYLHTVDLPFVNTFYSTHALLSFLNSTTFWESRPQFCYTCAITIKTFWFLILNFTASIWSFS